MLVIRSVQQTDNEILAKIIHQCFHDFKAPTAGTVYEDPATDNLYDLFHRKNSVLWVAEFDGEIVGCCGVYPDADLPDDTVELVKFYIASSARGKGIGKALMERSIASAREFGFRKIYIESLPEFHVAVSLYLKYGFQYIDTALGCSTHPGCNVWMVKEI